MEEEVSQGAITYITMLSAMQVVLNCSLELQGTIYDQGKVKQKVREAINQMTLQNAKNRNKIWKVDEVQAASFMHAIQKIGETIAKDNGMILSLITKLSREDFDLTKCVVTELTEEELEQKRAAL